MASGNATAILAYRHSTFKLRMVERTMDGGSIHVRNPSPNAATSSYGMTRPNYEKQPPF